MRVSPRVKYQRGPLLSINYVVAGRGEREKKGGDWEDGDAIGWKYDSPLQPCFTKFTATVIDIGTAGSLLRAAVR